MCDDGEESEPGASTHPSTGLPDAVAEEEEKEDSEDEILTLKYELERVKGELATTAAALAAAMADGGDEEQAEGYSAEGKVTGGQRASGVLNRAIQLSQQELEQVGFK